MLHFMITIDEVFLKEADELLYEELWKPLGLAGDTRKKFKADGEEFVFVALLLGQVVGTIVFSVKSESAEIRHAAIRSEYQGTGIGRKLTEQVIDYLKKKGLKNVDVYARDTSVEFWEKNGFAAATEWLELEPLADRGIKVKKMTRTL